MIGHLSDAERIFSYRLLRAARNDRTLLPSFDENKYVESANFDERPVEDVAGELAAVRQATLALLGSLRVLRGSSFFVASIVYCCCVEVRVGSSTVTRSVTDSTLLREYASGK